MATIPFLLCNCVYHEGIESRCSPFKTELFPNSGGKLNGHNFCQLVFLHSIQALEGP